MRQPEFIDILDAARIIRKHLPPTPFHHYPRLSAQLGFDVFVKHENCQPVGAFKIRGGINLVARMTADERKVGIIGSSTGNHGQSLGWAGRLFGVRVRIGVPVNANPDKLAAMRALGATVELRGQDFDETRLWVEAEAERSGMRYVHSANEPDLIAGVGTIGLEMLEAEPSLDTIIAPVGGGSGAAGISIAAKTINAGIRMIAVQSAHARSAYDSWKAGRVLGAGISSTFAEGMATRQAFELTQSILRRNLDDFVLVNDDELRNAIRMLFEHTHHAAEGAGAASLAAAIQLRESLQGRRVGLDLSGGNITAGDLSTILSRST